MIHPSMRGFTEVGVEILGPVVIRVDEVNFSALCEECDWFATGPYPRTYHRALKHWREEHPGYGAAII